MSTLSSEWPWTYKVIVDAATTALASVNVLVPIDGTALGPAVNVKL